MVHSCRITQIESKRKVKGFIQRKVENEIHIILKNFSVEYNTNSYNKNYMTSKFRRNPS